MTGFAKPNQVDVLTGWRRLAHSAGLLTISAFDRIAGLSNRHLYKTGEYAYANDFQVSLSVMTDHGKH